MAKNSPAFTCTACGAAHKKWAGRCDACNAWNTVIEEAPLSAGPKSLGARGRVITLTDLATKGTPPPRATCGINEFDRVLGGGLVEAISEVTSGRRAQGRFLFSGTVELLEDYGFQRVRQVGKHAWIVSKHVLPG